MEKALEEVLPDGADRGGDGGTRIGGGDGDVRGGRGGGTVASDRDEDGSSERSGGSRGMNAYDDGAGDFCTVLPNGKRFSLKHTC